MMQTVELRHGYYFTAYYGIALCLTTGGCSLHQGKVGMILMVVPDLLACAAYVIGAAKFPIPVG
jgi:hypothetical protein